MSIQRSIIRPVARRARLLLAIATGVSSIVPFINVMPAHADANVGDLVFSQGQEAGLAQRIVLRKSSDSSEATLDPADDSAQYPDVSPDGRRIVYSNYKLFLGTDNNYHGGQSITVMNSDGSGQRQLTVPDIGSSDGTLHFYDYNPRWSPDGTKIAFYRQQYVPSTNVWVYLVYSMNFNPSDSSVSDITPLTSASDHSILPVWTPSGKITFVRETSSLLRQWMMDADGSNPHIIDPSTTCQSIFADWGSSSRLYFIRYCGGYIKVAFLTSSDSFATATNSTEHEVLDRGTSEIWDIRIGAGGATAYYAAVNLYALSIVDNETPTETQLTSGESNYSPAPVNTTWPTAAAKTLVALGDSVAAGEGINYGYLWDPDAEKWHGGLQDIGTDGWVDTTAALGANYQRCHQSGQAYSRLFYQDNYKVRHMACTGASALWNDGLEHGGVLDQEHFSSTGNGQYVPDAEGTTYVPAQLGGSCTDCDAPNTAHYDPSSSRPDIVTLTLGANDINFDTWVKECYQPIWDGGWCNTETNGDTVESQLEAAKTDLHTTLQEIHDRGVADSKVPHVYITGYYDPFPTTYSEDCVDLGLGQGGWVNAGLTSDEVEWLRGYLDDLNTNIKDVAAGFSNVTFVDLKNVMSGHRWCSSDPWAYGASIDAPTWAGGAAGASAGANPSPFHPTPAGQRGIYNAIKNAMTASGEVLGFETANLSEWDSQSTTPPTICDSTTTPSCTPNIGAHAADLKSTDPQTGGVQVTKNVASPAPTAGMSAYFNMRSASTNASLFYFKTSSGGSMFHVYLDYTNGKVGIRTDAGTPTTYPGCNQGLPTSYPWSAYHKVEARTVVASSGNSVIQLWVDGQPVKLSGADGTCNTSDDSATLLAAIGNTNAGKLILGDTASNRTFEFWADDATAATSNAGTVSGTVTRLDGTTAVSGANVGISGQLGTTTDASGNYTLTGVPTGTNQTVTASLAGYLTGSATVNVSSGGSATQNFSLKKALFSDNFETGNLSNWTSNFNVTACTTSVTGCPRAGVYGARATASGSTSGYARKVLTATASEVYFRTYVYVASQGSNNVSLLQLANSSGALIAHVFLNSSHQVGIRNDVTATTTQSTTTLSTGAWHSLEFHVKVNGTSSTTDVFLDGTAISSLASTSANLGTNNVSAVWLGENQTGRTYDVLFDDAVVQDGYVGS